MFLGVHSIATDSKGNIYTTETYTGKRLQKFVFKGDGPGHEPKKQGDALADEERQLETADGSRQPGSRNSRGKPVSGIRKKHSGRDPLGVAPVLF